ncbi:MAG TPA: DnaB-like helicase N-terminal domain-containing protein, partial [Parachlamydiaceae bacterium]|nr:DnaB-like helicase N-terminal domain-containing protein [Parachlamydiaceae bacterium]
MSENSPKIKIAPNSKDSEMMVLGCMLTNINGLNIAADGLDDADFYYTEHKIIFGVLKTAYKSDKPADVHLVCEELKRLDKLKSVGGAAYITTLAQYAGTSAYLEEYVNIVRDKAILRKMIHVAQTVEKTALEEPPSVLDALDEAQQMFFKISQHANQSTGKLIGEILSGVKAESNQPFLKELQERQETFQIHGAQDSGVTGVLSHFKDLDKMINGLGNSNLM